MLTRAKIMVVSIGVLSLSGCASDYFGGYDSYQTHTNQNSMLYPEGYDTQVTAVDVPEKQSVVVPETYHVSAYHSPTPSKDVDRGWIDSQNPQGYTIELADGDKPSQVSGALSKAPKRERMAEVKYQHEGKTYYKGLYGSYSNYDEAQNALNALPDDVKSGAGIKAWGNVQKTVNSSQ